MDDFLHVTCAMSLVVEICIFEDLCQQFDLSFAGNDGTFGQGDLDRCGGWACRSAFWSGGCGMSLVCLWGNAGLSWALWASFWNGSFVVDIAARGVVRGWGY